MENDKPIGNDTLHSDESLKLMTIAISNSKSPVVKRRRHEKKMGYATSLQGRESLKEKRSLAKMYNCGKHPLAWSNATFASTQIYETNFSFTL